jgi:hypothetical protein
MEAIGIVLVIVVAVVFGYIIINWFSRVVRY